MSQPSNGNSVGPSVLLNLQQMVDVLSHGTINRLGINFSDRYDDGFRDALQCPPTRRFANLIEAACLPQASKIGGFPANPHASGNLKFRISCLTAGPNQLATPGLPRSDVSTMLLRGASSACLLN